MARKSGSTRRPVSLVAAQINRRWPGALALMLLAACTSPPASSPVAAEAPEPVSAPEVTSPPVAVSDAPTSPATDASTTSAEVDPSQLPEDVRDFILKQRMCRHFSRPESEGGNPSMAGVMCAGADESAWKALVRKYQNDDAVASVLLAERPPAEATK